MKIAIIENTGKDFFKSRIRLAKYLKNNGHEITIIVPNDGYLTKIKEANFRVISVGELIRGRGITNQIKFAYDLFKILKKNKFDVIHCFRMQPNIIGGFLAGLLGHKNVINHITGLGIIFTYHSTKFKIQQFMVKLMYQFNNKVFKTKYIFQNYQDPKDLNIKSHFKVIKGSSVDESKFYPIQIDSFEEFTKSTNATYLLFASRLLKSKGLADAVLAVDVLNKKTNSSVKLLISGSIDKNNFDSFSEDEISNLSKNKNIFFLGNRDNIHSLINFVDICILPSYYREGTPRFLLEAMACAKPIVTMEMPGCEHLIDKKNPNGVLVRPRDYLGLAEAIAKINIYPEKYNGQNSLNLYHNFFSENIVFSAIQQFYFTTNRSF
jgi:glycosyltransferase involved in cell wall biosynthesis